MNLFWVFVVSAIPLIEQRGAIPLGIFGLKIFGLSVAPFNPMLVFLVSFLGSLLPVPFILLLFNAIFKWMKNYRFLDKFTNFLENKIRKNVGPMEKYKEIGLITFVAIPLPTTGLWTGSMIAAFLGLDFKKSFLCNALGGLISAAIITIICVVFPSILGY